MTNDSVLYTHSQLHSKHSVGLAYPKEAWGGGRDESSPRHLDEDSIQSG